MKLTTAQFESYQNENSGYCKDCDEITTDGVEPDAEEYECPECRKETVMGLDNALVLEHIEIMDDDLDEEDSDEDDEEFKIVDLEELESED
jgi:Zn finger protein HypA/HybF involved in hydrogenase expression